MHLQTASFHTYPRGWPYYPGSWLSYSKFQYRIEASNALRRGMERAGIKTLIGPKWKPSKADIAVIWSWKRPQIIETAKRKNTPLIVMERGFIQPRNEWVSLALNGFNNRGYFPPANDGGKRWEEHFSHHLRPWQERKGYALLIGQVPGDSSLNGLDIVKWAQSRTDALLKAGQTVVYRPHPLADTPVPDGTVCSRRDLQTDLKHAGFVVTFGSTTAVEAVLAGVPVCVEDKGSVAYPMGSHHIDEPLKRPDRTRWCHDLAWRQWSINELKNGMAWRHLSTAFLLL
ncbi:hypothetical protein ACLBWZ_08070 [Brucellaceae bacterium C25G]